MSSFDRFVANPEKINLSAKQNPVMIGLFKVEEEGALFNDGEVFYVECSIYYDMISFENGDRVSNKGHQTHPCVPCT